MNETLSTQDSQDRPPTLLEKQDAILAGALDISELSEPELRELESINHPNREEDVDRARAIADATHINESGMAESRSRIDAASTELSALEDAKQGASLGDRLRIGKQMRSIDNDLSDIGDEYWEDVTAQRDKNAAVAATDYDQSHALEVAAARAVVQEVINEPK